MTKYTVFQGWFANFTGACAAVMMMFGNAYADTIEWSQVQNIEKGQGVPSGITLDVLGIEIGDTYASAKAKLEEMKAALIQEGATVKLRERKAFFKIPTGAGQFVETTFVSDIELDINRYPNQPNGETITTHFSAPSSGAQVYSIKRSLSYSDHTNQPKISDLATRLTAKLGLTPFRYDDGRRRETRLVYVFNNGKAVQGVQTTQEAYVQNCFGVWSSLAGGYTQHNSTSIQTLNRGGRCDIAMTLILNHGVSEDHFERATFYLSDFERAKANIGADYHFFENYINTLQSTGGEGPKL